MGHRRGADRRGRGRRAAEPRDRGRAHAPLHRGGYPDGTSLPRVTMASLRHGFATACVNEGMEVSKPSRIMGHADIKITMRYYVRQKLDDLKVAVDAMDGGDVGNRWQ